MHPRLTPTSGMIELLSVEAEANASMDGILAESICLGRKWQCRHKEQRTRHQHRKMQCIWQPRTANNLDLKYYMTANQIFQANNICSHATQARKHYTIQWRS